MTVTLQPTPVVPANQLPDKSGLKGGVLTPFGWMHGSVNASADASPASTESAPPPLQATTDPQPAAQSATPAAPADIPATQSSPETLNEAMSALQASLTAAKVDTSKFTLTPREDLYWTPFGSFYDRSIEVRTPDGQWTLLSADLTAKSPDVAVCDIERLLGTLSV